MKNNYRNLFSRLSHLILEDGEDGEGDDMTRPGGNEADDENQQQAAPEEEKT